MVAAMNSKSGRRQCEDYTIPQEIIAVHKYNNKEEEVKSYDYLHPEEMWHLIIIIKCTHTHTHMHTADWNYWHGVQLAL